MPEETPASAIIAHIKEGLDNPEPYVRAVLAKLWECKRQNGDAMVRFEVGDRAGPPNYRTESLIEETGRIIVIGGFSGKTHRRLPIGKVEKSRQWSDTVSLDELAKYLGELRRFKLKRK
jgi:hypothetical protein